MPYFPVLLNIQGKRCLVVGGGRVALRRGKSLLNAGAAVTVVSPTFHPDFNAISGFFRLERPLEMADIENSVLVVAATDDSALNRKIVECCREKNILCNSVDGAVRGDVVIPSTIDRGDLTIAISTSGVSPAYSARLRREIEEWLPPNLSEYLAFLRTARDLARERMQSAKEWRELARYLASDEAYDRFSRMAADERSAWLDQLLEERE